MQAVAQGSAVREYFNREYRGGDRRGVTSTRLRSWTGDLVDDRGAGTGWDVQTLMVVSAPRSETPAAMI